MGKILFKATLREINFLKERGYLNKKGLEWANNYDDDAISEVSE